MPALCLVGGFKRASCGNCAMHISVSEALYWSHCRNTSSDRDLSRWIGSLSRRREIEKAKLSEDGSLLSVSFLVWTCPAIAAAQLGRLGHDR